MLGKPAVWGVEEFVQPGGEGDIVDFADGGEIGDGVWRDGGNRWRDGVGESKDLRNCEAGSCRGCVCVGGGV